MSRSLEWKNRLARKETGNEHQQARTDALAFLYVTDVSLLNTTAALFVVDVES